MSLDMVLKTGEQLKVSKTFLKHAFLWLLLIIVTLGHTWYFAYLPQSWAHWYYTNPRREGFIMHMVSVSIVWSMLWILMQGPKHGLFKHKHDWLYVYGTGTIFLLVFCFLYEFLVGPIKW